jgi:hypothetical protein
MKPVFVDTETCGFFGVPVLLQYAQGDDAPTLHELWKTPICDSLRLVEWLCQNDIVLFNATFDWFHLIKIYNMFRLCNQDWIPAEHISAIANLEMQARDGLCLKPKGVHDIYLYAKSGPYQSTMDRKPIYISKVPVQLAEELKKELEARIKLDPILFARSKLNWKGEWKIEQTDEHDPDPDFRNLVLRFAPEASLKILAHNCLGVDVTFFDDVKLPDIAYPIEYGWAPFAKAHKGAGVELDLLDTDGSKKIYWKGTWPEKIQRHIDHWAYNDRARGYAKDDVIFTRGLYNHFGKQPMNDENSYLAVMVANTRWKGFKIDLDGLKAKKKSCLDLLGKVPIAPDAAWKYIYAELGDDEKKMFKKGTSKQALDSLIKYGIKRADEVKQARIATKEIELYDKLIQAGRFHPSLKVMGTLSSRMAGADGLNPQGIKHTKDVRCLFTFVLDEEAEEYEAGGGDLKSAEVGITVKVYPDQKLLEDLNTGKKIHGLFGTVLFDEEYEDVLATEGTEDDHYSKGKQGVFTIIFGGSSHTLMTRLGIPEEQAVHAEQGWAEKYPDFAKARQKDFDRVQSMKQPGGVGTKVFWNKPAEFSEGLLGHRRYFTLENTICEILFKLAQKIPDSWAKMEIKCIRRDREQFIGGAVSSALYGAAFRLQQQCMRAFANNRIQSTCAQMCKQIQCKLWDLQPVGIGALIIRLLNVHDEIESVYLKKLRDTVKSIVDSTIVELRKIVPMTAMPWKSNIRNWAEK